MPDYASNDPRVNFSYVFDFEETFDYKGKVVWMRDNWTDAYYYVAIYIFLIFSGQYLMRNRERFELRKPLIAWNVTLAIFSVIGTCRTFVEVFHVWNKFGFEFSVCSRSYYRNNPVVAFWVWLFVLSKVIELFDTFFVILRKQKLVVLHWYHHVTVLLYSWYSYQHEISVARWFVSINYTIHAFMYSYYAATAMKFRVPKSVAMAITSLQLMQMVVGLYVNYWAYQVLSKGEDCGTNLRNVKVSLMMYASYCLLFVNFFYKSYVRNSRRKVD